MTTATSKPHRCRFCTIIDGNGSILPFDRMSASVNNNLSSMGKPTPLPSSLTPTNTTPGFCLLGRSLANAQIACRIFSLSDNELFRSARSDSSFCSNSSSSRSSIVILPSKNLRPTQIARQWACCSSIAWTPDVKNHPFTTKLTILPGTTIDFTTVLPAKSSPIFASAAGGGL